jgi:hypothetical protein
MLQWAASRGNRGRLPSCEKPLIYAACCSVLQLWQNTVQFSTKLLLPCFFEQFETVIGADF